MHTSNHVYWSENICDFQAIYRLHRQQTKWAYRNKLNSRQVWKELIFKPQFGRSWPCSLVACSGKRDWLQTKKRQRCQSLPKATCEKVAKNPWLLLLFIILLAKHFVKSEEFTHLALIQVSLKFSWHYFRVSQLKLRNVPVGKKLCSPYYRSTFKVNLLKHYRATIWQSTAYSCAVHRNVVIWCALAGYKCELE